MRKIEKSIEPASLTQYKIDNPHLSYSDLANGNESIRIDIRNSCLTEQYFLCAYCCDWIDFNYSHNEHIIPQKSIPGNDLTLDYKHNIVVSCESNKHCGHHKANKSIDLTPLMLECQNEIVYQLNGKMTHSTPRAQDAITKLNLRNKALEHKRKVIIDAVLFDYVDDLELLSIEENYFLELIIVELTKSDNRGKLEAFSPVLINVLKQFITT